MNKQLTAYIALGSNIEPKSEHLSSAIRQLEDNSAINITKKSAIYETVPKGYVDQDNFLNMVIEVKTTLSALNLLKSCQAIEVDLKRIHKIKNGPRTIDLDIILYGDVVSNQEPLILPHPRMHQRAFVLFPLADVAAEVVVPTLNKSVVSLREQLLAAEKADVRQVNVEL